NPVPTQGGSAVVEVYAAPRGQTIRVGPRNARDAEMESYLTALLRARRALGPLICGQELDQISVQDLGRAGDRERAAYCRQGYGTLLARLAAGLPVRLSAPVSRIDWYRDRVELATPRGKLEAPAAT